MKFDFVIGNPPYQEENNTNVRKAPVYHLFMDESYKIANTVELITPARFLFNAGQTPKNWNKKMLNDEHFQVLFYEPDATKIFPNQEIKGGIVITLRDNRKYFGKIDIFTLHNELNDIIKKIHNIEKNNPKMDSIVSSRGCYRLTDAFFKDFPEASSRVGTGTANMLVSNIFEKIPEAFIENIPTDSINDYFKILGRIGNTRVYRYIKKIYVQDNDYINSYKMLLPEANGNGIFGDVLSGTLICENGVGSTDTFLSVGSFDTRNEAENVLKYMKTKFARALLFTKKATQHTPKDVWSIIPIQNFTSNSDINWSVDVSNIDKQLYKKYSLTDEDIEFIEKNVKGMT